MSTTNGGAGAASAATQTRTVPARPAVDRPGPPVFTPPVDVYETEREYIVYADIPGAQPDEIDVRYADGELTIDAPARVRAPAGARALVTEYGVGPYHRAFRLGEGIDPTGVRADQSAGVLTLRLPKSKSATPRRIQVQTR